MGLGPSPKGFPPPAPPPVSVGTNGSSSARWGIVAIVGGIALVVFVIAALIVTKDGGTS